MGPTNLPTLRKKRVGSAKQAPTDTAKAVLEGRVAKSTLGFHACPWKPVGRTLFVRPLSQPVDLSSIMESLKFLRFDGLTQETAAV
jgi:hypothetical protein